MNYIELNLGGKKRGAKLGIGFLRYLTESKKMSLDDVLKEVEGTNSILAIPEFIYLSISYNDKRKGVKIDLNIDDVMDMIDEDGGVKGEAVQSFLKAFTESLGVDMGKDQPQEKVAKK